MSKRKRKDSLVRNTMHEFEDDSDTAKLDESSSETVLYPKAGSSRSPCSDIKMKNVELSGESSEDEWEEVQNENEEEEEEKEVVIPKEGVEITLAAEDFIKRRKKKGFDWNNYARLCVNRFKREIQQDLHKIHVLCLLSHGLFVNNIINNELIKGLIMSVIPEQFSKLKPKKIDVVDLKNFILWFRGEFRFELTQELRKNDLNTCLLNEINNRIVTQEVDYVAIMISAMRLLGLDTRLIISMQPISVKPTDLIKPKPSEINEEEKCGKKKSVARSNSDENKTVPKKCASKRKSTAKKSDDDENKSGKSRKNVRTKVKKVPDEELSENDEKESEVKKKRGGPRKASKKVKIKVDVDDNDDDDDFEPENVERNSNRKRSLTTTKVQNGVNRMKKVKPNEEFETGNDYWAEVYLEKKSAWICIDCINGFVDCGSEMESKATQPLIYVVSFDNKNKVKDLTRRYADNWLSFNRKFRFDPDWWTEVLEPHKPRLTNREKKENAAMDKALSSRPLPTTIGEYKGHPLYCLTRHLLKFEALYPPESVPVGFIRGEPVYSRDCVHTLHSRDTWLKQAKTIRIGEKPYKTVKARPKWNKHTRQLDGNLPPLEIYGEWQVQDYEPPVAVNGKIPRNEYGNVDLFQEKMLPIGTVHLRVPRLLKVARKLGIDCVPAMTGWDFVKSGNRPIFDGWVVCKEFKDVLMEAWRDQMKIDLDRIGEKREKRVYGNWRRLIRAVLIRERLNTKYFKLRDK